MDYVSFPIWRPTQEKINLRRLISDSTVSGGILKSANTIKLGFPLRRDTPDMERLSKKWELEFLRYMETVNLPKVEVNVIVCVIGRATDFNNAFSFVIFFISFSLSVKVQ